MTLKDWKKPKKGTGTLSDWIFYETKRRSKIYKGQPKDEIIVRPHPLKKGKWTMDFGQAPISMGEFDTKSQAIKSAKQYMKLKDVV